MTSKTAENRPSRNEQSPEGDAHRTLPAVTEDSALRTLPDVLADIPPEVQYEVRQALIFGQSPAHVAHNMELDLHSVLCIMRSAPEFSGDLSPSDRRIMALARIDALGAVVFDVAHTTKDMGAARTWIDLQKRESALAGLDAPEQSEQRVTIDVPWLTPNRLAYKQSATLAADIASTAVTDVLPREVRDTKESE